MISLVKFLPIVLCCCRGGGEIASSPRVCLLSYQLACMRFFFFGKFNLVWDCFIILLSAASLFNAAANRRRKGYCLSCEFEGTWFSPDFSIIEFLMIFYYVFFSSSVCIRFNFFIFLFININQWLSYLFRTWSDQERIMIHFENRREQQPKLPKYNLYGPRKFSKEIEFKKYLNVGTRSEYEK